MLTASRHLGRALALMALAALAACGHEAPFGSPPSGNVGPFGSATPLRLTFSEGADATPSVWGDQLLFSRQSAEEPGAYTPAGREQCIAFMPVAGGTVSRELCPHLLIPQPDTFVDTWFEPSLSPDGTRLAYMWQRGLRVSALGYVDTYLMVTPADRPQDTTGTRLILNWIQPRDPDEVRGTTASRIRWEDATHLLFLATYEHIRKVKGGGAERVTDTSYDPLALMRLDLGTGIASLVPGGDSVQAWDFAPGGGAWVTKQWDSSAVYRLGFGTPSLTPVATFPRPVTDLANVGGRLVVITMDSTAVQWVDSAAAIHAIGPFAGPLHRLTAAGGRRFVVEVEQGQLLFGRPPDLWLLELP